MNKPDEQREREPEVQRRGLHPEKAEGEPFDVPPPDARPAPYTTPPDYHPARAVPKEPLPPQD